MTVRRLTILLFFFACCTLCFQDVSAQFFKGKDKKDDKVDKNLSDQEAQRKSEYFLAEGEKYFILEDYAKAFVLYQKALEYDEQNATAYYKISKIYQDSEEFDKALSYALKAIELSNKNKYFYLQAAEIYSKQDNYEAAVGIYRDMFANCDDTNEYLFELAALYIYEEAYDKAIDTYNKIERIYGINEQIVKQKQKLYIQQSNLEGALEEGQKLINSNPGEAAYVISLAEILISNGQQAKATEYLEQFLKEYDEEDPQVKLMLAEVYRDRGSFEKSRAYLKSAFSSSNLELKPKLRVLGKYMSLLPNDDVEELTKDLSKRLIETHPDDPNVYAVAGDLYMKLGEKPDAEGMYQKAIDNGANSFNIWYNLIQLANASAHYDNVVKYGEEAIEYFPNQPEIYFFLGTGHMMKKDYQEAIEVMKAGKMLTNNNEELKALFNAQLGDAYNYTEEYDKSDEAYELALAHNPNNDHVLNNYAYFLSLRKERLEEAKKMSTKLVKRNPDNATFLDTHAWVLYMNGEFEKARHYIEKAISTGDVSGTIIEHYGDILFQLGQVDSAVKQWQRAKGMDETSDLIDKKIADRKLYE